MAAVIDRKAVATGAAIEAGSMVRAVDRMHELIAADAAPWIFPAPIAPPRRLFN